MLSSLCWDAHTGLCWLRSVRQRRCQHRRGPPALPKPIGKRSCDIDPQQEQRRATRVATHLQRRAVPEGHGDPRSVAEQSRAAKRCETQPNSCVAAITAYRGYSNNVLW